MSVRSPRYIEGDRKAGEPSSYLTAPKRAPSHSFLSVSTVLSGKATPVCLNVSKPASRSIKENCNPRDAGRASRSRRPAGMTSRPMPSPGIRPIGSYQHLPEADGITWPERAAYLSSVFVQPLELRWWRSSVEMFRPKNRRLVASRDRSALTLFALGSVTIYYSNHGADIVFSNNTVDGRLVSSFASGNARSRSCAGHARRHGSVGLARERRGARRQVWPVVRLPQYASIACTCGGIPSVRLEPSLPTLSRRSVG